MNNQPWVVRSMLIDVNPGELPYYPVIISLGRCDRSYNTVEDPFGRICVLSKMEDVNSKLFSFINLFLQIVNLKKALNNRYMERFRYHSLLS